MFIPRSNIIEIGYTNIGRFYKTNVNDPLLIRDNTSKVQYEGYYHKDNKNNYWTDKDHSNNSVVLIEIREEDLETTEYTAYDNLNPKKFVSTVISPDFILPIDSDYDSGYFYRYIIKPVISNQINDFFEVNANNFQQIIQSSELLLLYKPVSLIWKLTGPLYDIYDGNIRIRAGIIDTNKRSITEAEKISPNVSLYFTDLRQFGSSV
jgi:hypothetical protein